MIDSGVRDKRYRPSFSVQLMRLLHLDPLLSLGIGLLLMVGLGVLYSAGDQSMELIHRQLTRIALALVVMLVVAQIPRRRCASGRPGFMQSVYCCCCW